jgi:uncharacterized membrane protein YvbJ
MSDCPYCGKELAEGEIHCYHCENDLSDKESYKNKPEKSMKERITIFFKPLIDYFKKK